ncbi:hypothetical protein KCP70_20800 [Salmonella enterica subsp. enterica]|nr:hypothetical protein KCP70_20800 [Salmonella enterica subsp. enterica]
MLGSISHSPSTPPRTALPLENVAAKIKADDITSRALAQSWKNTHNGKVLPRVSERRTGHLPANVDWRCTLTAPNFLTRWLPTAVG